MQNLRTKVGQLGSFFEVQVTYRRSLVYDARVIIVHTVNICPYLDFGGVYSGTDQ